LGQVVCILFQKGSGDILHITEPNWLSIPSQCIGAGLQRDSRNSALTFYFENKKSSGFFLTLESNQTSKRLRISDFQK